MRKMIKIKAVFLPIVLAVFLLLSSSPEALALNKKKKTKSFNEFAGSGMVIGPKRKKKRKFSFKPFAIKDYRKRKKSARKRQKTFMKKMLKQKPPRQKIKKRKF